MRHFEIINETTEEDRAIISLGSAIYDRLKGYEETEPEDSYSSDYDDYDPDDDFDDEPKPDEELTTVGRIGDLFDTPLEILEPVTIELQSSYGIEERRKRDEGADVTRDPETGVILGLWYPYNSTIVLNKDYIGKKALKSAISHELRHALDDYKSDFEASSSTSYNRPKNPKYRGVKNHPVLGNVAYLAEPAEINARFVQVLNDMVSVVKQASKMDEEDAEEFISNSLRRAMETRKIYDLFPEKEASKDYKRLMSRAMDFITKERDSLEPIKPA